MRNLNRWKARKERLKAIAAEQKLAEHSRLMETNIRPYLVTEENFALIAEVGGFDKELLFADLMRAKASNKALWVHLRVEDIRAAGGLSTWAVPGDG